MEGFIKKSEDKKRSLLLKMTKMFCPWWRNILNTSAIM